MKTTTITTLLDHLPKRGDVLRLYTSQNARRCTRKMVVTGGRFEPGKVTITVKSEDSFTTGEIYARIGKALVRFGRKTYKVETCWIAFDTDGTHRASPVRLSPRP